MAGKLSRWVVLVLIVMIGLALLAIPITPTDNEGNQRAAVVRRLAAGVPTAANDPSTSLPRKQVVAPITIKLEDIQPWEFDPDNQYDRWLRGEIDLLELDAIVSENELNRLREEARTLEPSAHVQVPPGGPQPNAFFTGLGFEALQFSECCGGGGGMTPPDPQLAVGENHVIAVVNAAFEIYDKSGTSVQAPTTFASFFSSWPGCTNLFDPNVLYDEERGRYLMGIDSDGKSYCLGVSASSNPLGSWYLFAFDTASGADFFDYPQMGVGRDAIYIGANIFDGSFKESRVYAIDKDSLYNGQPAPSIWRTLTNGDDTPIPLHLHGWSQGTWPTTGPHAFFASAGFNGQTYSVWTWSNPLAGTLPVRAAVVDLEAYTGVDAGYPVEVKQSGGLNIDGGDIRPQDFEYRNGFGWTVQTISCRPYDYPYAETINCIRWAKIDLATAAITDAGVFGNYYENRTYADLAVDRCDSMAVGYTRTPIYNPAPSIYFTGRRAYDPPGILGEWELTVREGDGTYQDYSTPLHRWGDYTEMTIAPDGKTFWYIGEYSQAESVGETNWATYINSFTIGDCPGQFAGYDFLVSTTGSGRIGGVAFVPADIIAHDKDSNQWRMYFDASDVGIKANVSAIALQRNGGLLLSFVANQAIPGLGTIKPQDVVRFIPTTLGDVTSGRFEWYFRGGEEGLTTTAEKIDALGFVKPYYHWERDLRLSTTGAASLLYASDLRPQDEDILNYTVEDGYWYVEFDGSTIPGLAGEDITGYWATESAYPLPSEVYLTLLDTFNLSGVRGNAKSIVKLTANNAAAGGYTPSIYWNGTAARFPTNLDALEIFP